MGEYKALLAKSKDPAQTQEARTEAEKSARAKLEITKQKQQEIQAFTQNVRKALSQRVESFRHAYGDDPNTPPPQPPAGAGPFELRRLPADNASQATKAPPSGN